MAATMMSTRTMSAPIATATVITGIPAWELSPGTYMAAVTGSDVLRYVTAVS